MASDGILGLVYLVLKGSLLPWNDSGVTGGGVGPENSVCPEEVSCVFYTVVCASCVSLMLDITRKGRMTHSGFTCLTKQH